MAKKSIKIKTKPPTDEIDVLYQRYRKLLAKKKERHREDPIGKYFAFNPEADDELRRLGNKIDDAWHKKAGSSFKSVKVKKESRR